MAQNQGEQGLDPLRLSPAGSPAPGGGGFAQRTVVPTCWCALRLSRRGAPERTNKQADDHTSKGCGCGTIVRVVFTCVSNPASTPEGRTPSSQLTHCGGVHRGSSVGLRATSFLLPKKKPDHHRRLLTARGPWTCRRCKCPGWLGIAAGCSRSGATKHIGAAVARRARAAL